MNITTSRLVVATLSGLAICHIASAASATTLDFEDGQHFVAVDDTYAGSGLHFSNAQFLSRTQENIDTGVETTPEELGGGSGDIHLTAIEFDNSIRPNNPHPHAFFGPEQPIVITFDTPAASVSVLGLNVGSGGIRIDAFSDPAGLDEIQPDANELNEMFGTGVGYGQALRVTFDSAAGIRRVAIYTPLGTTVSADGIWLDDLEFQLVPEPSTVVLLALGLLGVSARRSG